MFEQKHVIGLVWLFLLCGVWTAAAQSGPSATTTTLAITPGASVTAGTVVTLTATVSTGGSPASPGQVLFCNANSELCEDLAVFGTAQVTAAGTASIKLTLGAGTYSIQARFVGSKALGSSFSTAHPLTVTGNSSYPSMTEIDVQGSVNNYTLNAGVLAGGHPPQAGTVSFLDATNANGMISSATLDPSTVQYGFIPGISNATDFVPIFGVVGDFNNDGIVDFALANDGVSTVSIFFGNGDGTFQNAVSYTVGNHPLPIVIGDFNHDGNQDLAVANAGDDTISVLLGSANGTFTVQPPIPLTISQSNPSGMVVGDFNHDGIQDLAVVVTPGTGSASAVVILLGNGDGTFTLQQSCPLTAIPRPPQSAPDASVCTVIEYPVGNSSDTGIIVAADFDQDGNLDLAVTNVLDNTVSILLGNGDGTFQAQSTVSVGTNPIGIVTADFNGDGKPDLAVANNGDSTVTVLLGNGKAGFTTAATVPTDSANSGPFDVQVGDFNNDGFLDLVISNQNSGTVDLVFGNAAVTFLTPGGNVNGEAFPVASAPSGLIVSDLNGDGSPDVVVIDSGFSPPSAADIILGAQIVFASAPNVSVSNGPHQVAAHYPGDAERAASQSETTSVPGPTITATTFTVMPASPVAGQSTTFTATVTPAPVTSPFGTVTFCSGGTFTQPGVVGKFGAFGQGAFPSKQANVWSRFSSQFKSRRASLSHPNDGSVCNTGTELGSGTVDATGVATFTTTSLTAGTITVTAVYSGNVDSVASNSASQSITIAAPPPSTTTALTASPNPAVQGQTVTFTATITPSSAPGSVTFCLSGTGPTVVVGSPVPGSRDAFGSPVLSPNGGSACGAGTIIATVTVASGVAMTTTTTLPLGTDSITAVFISTGNFQNSTSTPVSEAINPPTPTTTTVNASPSPAFAAQTVTLSATVAPAPSGSPAGSVAFCLVSTGPSAKLGSAPAMHQGRRGLSSPNGVNPCGSGTLIGSANVTSGSASTTTTTLPTGDDGITAIYSGNATFAGSTSAPVSLTVNPAFAVAGPSTPVPIMEGGSAQVPLTVPPVGGAFNSVVTLSASGLPAGATATFNPPTVTPGANGAPTTLTVQLATGMTVSSLPSPAPAAPGSHPSPTLNGFLPGSFALLLVLAGTFTAGSRRQPRLRFAAYLLFVTALAGGALLLSACDGGFNGPLTPPGNLTITVTGTSGALQESTTVTLNVQ